MLINREDFLLASDIIKDPYLRNVESASWNEKVSSISLDEYFSTELGEFIEYCGY